MRHQQIAKKLANDKKLKNREKHRKQLKPSTEKSETATKLIHQQIDSFAEIIVDLLIQTQYEN